VGVATDSEEDRDSDEGPLESDGGKGEDAAPKRFMTENRRRGNEECDEPSDAPNSDSGSSSESAGEGSWWKISVDDGLKSLFNIIDPRLDKVCFDVDVEEV